MWINFQTENRENFMLKFTKSTANHLKKDAGNSRNKR